MAILFLIRRGRGLVTAINLYSRSLKDDALACDSPVEFEFSKFTHKMYTLGSSLAVGFQIHVLLLIIKYRLLRSV
jgi:hypothetical protein